LENAVYARGCGADDQASARPPRESDERGERTHATRVNMGDAAEIEHDAAMPKDQASCRSA
jgi:hypothetical protein